MLFSLHGIWEGGINMGSMDIHAFRMVFGSKKMGSPVIENRGSQLTTDADIEVIKTLSSFFRPRVVVEIGIFEGATSKAVLDSSPWIEKYIMVVKARAEMDAEANGVQPAPVNAKPVLKK
jgi:hypothetical protein